MLADVITRLSRFLIAVLLALTIGLHWTFLQCVAWTGMVITYSQDEPLVEAVAKTFDGKHPCSLCKQIAKEKQSERATDRKFEIKKLEFPYAPVAFTFCAPTFYWEAAASDNDASLTGRAPPVPPPRDLLA